MVKFPSLLSLCIEALKRQLVTGDGDLLPDIYEIPSNLFDCLVTQLPPLALEELQNEMPFKEWDDYESTNACFENGRKRGRKGNFTTAWKALFKLRWPEIVDRIQTDDWRQMYWETHLQNCLDQAAELAVLPSFNGCISEIKISDTILRYIGCEEQINHLMHDRSKLSYHCQHFGCYTRCLRLQGVLCVAETCQLLGRSTLQSLVLRWIRSEEHVEGLCKLLIQHSETLTSLEFIHCQLSSSFVNAICNSLSKRSTQTHGIQCFSINTSSFLETGLVSLPVGLVWFLKSGRSLCSLKLCCNHHLGRNFARMLWSTLLDVSSSLSVLDLSDNNIAGWLSTFNWRSSSVSFPDFEVGKPLQSLRLLNLRGNNLCKDDAERLRYALVHMPNLEVLDLSDNPVTDDGIRSLIPFFVEASERSSPLTELKIENCELSGDGVIQLLDTLSTLKCSLRSLSIAENGLGSQVAAALGKFLGTHIEALDIGDIGLGSSGFQEVQQNMVEESKLVDINISKNRGGIEAAKFMSKLMSSAPKLVAINAAYNLIPAESLAIICSALKGAKGYLKRLDLTGNPWDEQTDHASLLAEFQHNGKPVLILPSSLACFVPYDDDP